MKFEHEMEIDKSVKQKFFDDRSPDRSLGSETSKKIAK